MTFIDPPTHSGLNHRDTEKAQSHHIANTKTQRHEDITKQLTAIATSLQITQITQMAILEAQAHNEVPAVVERRLGTAGPGHHSERKRSSR